MAAHVVYQAHDGDGYESDYVELIVDSESDLADVKVIVYGQERNPAPGSVAYTPGVTKLWHYQGDGTWKAFA